MLPSAGLAAETDFSTWLDGLRSEAHGLGISQPTLNTALADIQPIPRVIELDRRQPEGTLRFEQYVKNVLTPSRIDRGRQAMRRHRALLQRIGAEYGVQPRFIVALWGIETGYGANTGGYPVIAALATLAYDGRRGAYFRRELLDALRILDQGHIAPATMKGSWAGAMGHSQFMPSSFLKYAVDADGDGRRDIWGTLPDVFASAAKYLSTVGWNDDQTWGREVRLPTAPPVDLTGLSGVQQRRSLAEWNRLGLRTLTGHALPRVPLQASLILPDGPGGRAFLIYDNYRTLLDWNRSLYFATTVGLLADRIGD